MAMDIRPGIPASPPAARDPDGTPGPRPHSAPAGAGATRGKPKLPSLLQNQKRLVPLVFGASAAAVLLGAVVWYAIGLPGAPAGLRRALGKLPEAGPRTLLIPAPEEQSLIAGLPCGDAYKRRPIAVMLGSDPVARPISGLADADLVFEIPVLTNNVTRLLAVYQCGHPPEIGGVRSTRHDYLFLAKGLDAVLAHWGGSYHALNRIRGERVAGGVPVYETIDAILGSAARAYFRVTRLPSPYNGYTSYHRLWEALKERSYRTYSVFQGYPHRDEAERGERGAGGALDVGWPGAMRVRYLYHPETNAYQRFWGGTRHEDGVENRPVRPTVLVVMHAEQRFAKGPGGYNDVDVEGQGPVEVYQNGQVIQGTWSKSEVHKQDPLAFVTPLGAPIAFIPGQVWIHVVDGRTPVVWTPGSSAPPEPAGGDTPAFLGG